ncbi:MAG: dihydroorotase [Proteobacteria bacterium]|nr:dihydroorotase [Pseudomonadota bacterium]
MTTRLMIKGGVVWSSGGHHRKDIITCEHVIEELRDPGSVPTGEITEVIDAQGYWVMPGVIDSQVHFREPGLEHKETLKTGSLGALLGGVTTFLEMPNTSPSTTSKAALEDKLERARRSSYTNYGFFIGATKDNLVSLKEAHQIPGCCGIKIFLGSSTGDLLLYDPQVLENIFLNTTLPISIHSEDETRLRERRNLRDNAQSVHDHERWRDRETALRSTKMVVELAKKCGRKIHILHISTKDEINFLSQHQDLISCEVTPQHLTLFAPDCYDQLGTLAQMNPPIRSIDHQDGLWQGIFDRTVKIIGSDHAPHTLAEKSVPYPGSPSGITGVQTMLPLMLNYVSQKKLSLPRLIELICENPARHFAFNKGFIAPGYDADLVLINPQKQLTLKNEDMASQSAWTPFHGLRVTGCPDTVIIGGKVAMKNRQVMELATDMSYLNRAIGPRPAIRKPIL